MFKQRRPWCLGCEAIGRRTPTAVPDHVVPHRGNQAIFWNTAKWQPACRWHHDAIKPVLERMTPRALQVLCLFGAA
jgi:5-methylcytosine-specific restriction protein A